MFPQKDKSYHVAVIILSDGEDEFYCTNDAESMALVPYAQEWEYKTLAE